MVQPEKVSQEPEAQEKEAEAAATTTPFLRGSVKATDDASTDGLGEGEEGDDVFFLFVPSFLRRPFFLSPPSITVVGGPGPSSLPLAAEGQVHEQGAGEVEDSGDSNNSDFFFPSFLRPDAIPFPALVQEWFFGNGGPLSPSDSAMEGPSSSSSSVVFVSDDGQGGSKVVVIQDGEEVAMPVVQQEDDVQLQAAQQQQQKENEAQTQERKQHALLLLLGAAVGAAFMLLGVFGAAIFNGGLRGVVSFTNVAAWRRVRFRVSLSDNAASLFNNRTPTSMGRPPSPSSTARLPPPLPSRRTRRKGAACSSRSRECCSDCGDGACFYRGAASSLLWDLMTVFRGPGTRTRVANSMQCLC